MVKIYDDRGKLKIPAPGQVLIDGDDGNGGGGGELEIQEEGQPMGPAGTLNFAGPGALVTETAAGVMEIRQLGEFQVVLAMSEGTAI